MRKKWEEIHNEPLPETGRIIVEHNVSAALTAKLKSGRKLEPETFAPGKNDLEYLLDDKQIDDFLSAIAEADFVVGVESWDRMADLVSSLEKVSGGFVVVISPDEEVQKVRKERGPYRGERFLVLCKLRGTELDPYAVYSGSLSTGVVVRFLDPDFVEAFQNEFARVLEEAEGSSTNGK